MENNATIEPISTSIPIIISEHHVIQEDLKDTLTPQKIQEINL